MSSFWIQNQPNWLPEGFQVPSEMNSHVQKLSQEAEIAYYSVDLERNGFLKKKEFRKALKKLGVNKLEAKHMLKMVNRERLNVVSIKNYVNAYLFIKSGGLNFINSDYQGPITSVVDQRTFMKGEGWKKPIQSPSFCEMINNVMQKVPRVHNSLLPRLPQNSESEDITLKSFNGLFLCSQIGSDVVANRHVAGPYEHFQLMRDSNYGGEYLFTVALKTHWNLYLCCEANNTINDNRQVVGPWEKFQIITVQWETTSYQSWTGKYLGSDMIGNVGFFSDTIGPGEIWVTHYY